MAMASRTEAFMASLGLQTTWLVYPRRSGVVLGGSLPGALNSSSVALKGVRLATCPRFSGQ